MKVLVTGASGFLGSHIAEQLVSAGFGVRLLLRPASSRHFLRFEYESAVGDVINRPSLAGAVTGVDAVVHAAGLIKARDDREFAAVNEHGTRNLVRTIEDNNPGLRRFVYISSLAAHGPSWDGRPRPHDARPAPVTAYGRTKLGGEAVLRGSALAERSVTFRMPVIYGPRDAALLPFFKLVRYRIAPLLAGGRNRISIVYVEDAARAVVQALTSEADVGGKTYSPEDGRVYSWRDLLAAVEAAAGRKAIMLPAPKLAYDAGALASETFGRVTSRAVVFTREKVREMAQPHWVCSSEDLRRDLGWESRVEIEEGARLTYEWYRRERWI